MSQRMLVTGCGGMVGSYVVRVFGDHDLIITDRIEGFPHLDVRDPALVLDTVTAARPDVVLHLAAATDVDRCEQDPEYTYHTNAIGTQNVALACRATGAVTAGVFWGDKPEPYHEFDTPRPANVYGLSKLAGEQIVTALLDRYYIIRAGWMFGGGARDKKFVGFITRKLLAGEPELRVVADKFGSPTYGKDLLRGIRALLETGYYGLYHMTNTGMCSRYEVALAIRDALGRSEVQIIPTSSANFPLPAPLARSEAMDNLKLRLLGLNVMRPWREALAEYVRAELVPALAGVPTLLLDREGWSVSPLYQLGVGRVVFTDWTDLREALVGHRRAPVPGFGDWLPMLDQLDPFRDGMAAYRMGSYLQWLIEGFKEGKDRDTVMADAAARYAARWGADKITEVRGAPWSGRASYPPDALPSEPVGPTTAQAPRPSQ